MRAILADKIRSIRGPRVRNHARNLHGADATAGVETSHPFGSFERPGAELPRCTIADFADFQRHKIDLVSGCKGAESLRDFGGLYLVFGKYLLDPAVRLRCRLASMVDVTPRAEFEQKKAEAQAAVPGLEVEFVPGDFRNPSLYPGLREVDASILFEVILHQENYIEVIRNVTSRTRKYVCFAQPCLRESIFSLPSASVLLQFYPQALKDILRIGTFWPEEPTVERFDTQYWMWGQSTSNIIAVFKGFGWELEWGEVIDNNMGKYWEFPLLRFRRLS